MKDLINNILNNIYKFKNILDSKESYFIEIPKLTGHHRPVPLVANLSDN